jgi:hydrogenase-4 component F
MSAAHMARHLGVLWIATEAVTLSAVPLLHFNNTPRAFEATWKYLLDRRHGDRPVAAGIVLSGIRLAAWGWGGGSDVCGADGPGGGVVAAVGIDRLGAAAGRVWHQDGAGADAHLEAGRLRRGPGIVGACWRAGSPRWRSPPSCACARWWTRRGPGVVADRTLLAIGLFSMLVAALFLLSARDFKRMLAYSSVEHMGILSLGAAWAVSGSGPRSFTCGTTA